MHSRWRARARARAEALITGLRKYFAYSPPSPLLLLLLRQTKHTGTYNLHIIILCTHMCARAYAAYANFLFGTTCTTDIAFTVNRSIVTAVVIIRTRLNQLLADCNHYSPRRIFVPSPSPRPCLRLLLLLLLSRFFFFFPRSFPIIALRHSLFVPARNETFKVRERIIHCSHG